MAAAEHAKDNVASVTIGVVHGAQLIWTRSYGEADAERKMPATRDTVYRIGSITKQFTALMLLQLVQDGESFTVGSRRAVLPRREQDRRAARRAPAILARCSRRWRFISAVNPSQKAANAPGSKNNSRMARSARASTSCRLMLNTF
jgi:hypothetical protein